MQAVKKRFESSLFDIRQIVQADLLDSELEAADLLIKHGFVRAGGAIAGVVMEKHLGQVCENHAIRIRKKKPKISDFNDSLKASEVIDTAQWRSNQFLADISVTNATIAESTNRRRREFLNWLKESRS